MEFVKKLYLISYKIFFIILILSPFSFSPSPIKLMNYNLLNYPGSDTTTRNPYFREIIASTNPDIIAVQEMTSQPMCMVL